MEGLLQGRPCLVYLAGSDKSQDVIGKSFLPKIGRGAQSLALEGLSRIASQLEQQPVLLRKEAFDLFTHETGHGGTVLPLPPPPQR
ncbi:MAG: hypothetical protein HW397_280 [Dehalococcoidia bacterium]|nr:hypothetical protein [Dehalococcoidia bacterium]